MTDRGRIDEVFFAALDLPDDARAGFVAEACGDDAGLRHEVESLLAADGSAGRFLDVPPAPPKDAPDPREGRTVGAWRIVRRIGAGGMGNVYLAERADQAFEKRAAVKIVRAGLSSEDILRRFRHERRVLASLDHPNIARVLDGGVTDDGVPFLVMEYVEGDPIDAWCERNGLDVDARLRLFRGVCDAVSHAHHKLVVHRDLKPSNILVDAAGRPKLLDFGIAKVLEAGSADDSATLPGAQALTPRYASPEQVRGEPATTATDVYSLGVVLYELLTGTRPYDTEGMSAREIERVVAEAAPLRPSVAAARTSPARARRLAGDLDTILLTALRKEPERRYGSVEQLSEDLRRHLEGYPVSARPDTVGVRAAKFVRRNPVLVTSVAALVVVLAAATAVSVALLLEARAAREEADAQRAAAEAVTDFLQDMLAEADPLATSRRDATVREVLDRAAEQVSGAGGPPPAVSSAVHFTLGRTYRALAEHERARDHFRASLASRPADAPVDLAAVATMRNLAAMHRELGAPDSAEAVLARALSEGAAALAAAPLELALYRVEQASVREMRGDWEEAERLQREALAVTRSVDAPPEDAVSARLNDLGVTLVRQGRYAEAESCLVESLAMVRRVHGPRAYETAQVAQNLGWARNSAGRHADAEAPLREAASIYAAILDPDHPLATGARMNLATALQQTGRGEESVAMIRSVVDADRRRFGERHTRVATDTANLALALGEAGAYEESFRLYAEARAIYEENLGAEHPWVATTLYSESVMRKRAGDAAGAERLARRCLELRRKALRAGHPDTAGTMRLLAELLAARGDLARAQALLEEAHAAEPEGSAGRARTEAVIGRLRGEEREPGGG